MLKVNQQPLLSLGYRVTFHPGILFFRGITEVKLFKCAVSLITGYDGNPGFRFFSGCNNMAEVPYYIKIFIHRAGSQFVITATGGMEPEGDL